MTHWEEDRPLPTAVLVSGPTIRNSRSRVWAESEGGGARQQGTLSLFVCTHAEDRPVLQPRAGSTNSRERELDVEQPVRVQVALCVNLSKAHSPKGKLSHPRRPGAPALPSHHQCTARTGPAPFSPTAPGPGLPHPALLHHPGPRRLPSQVCLSLEKPTKPCTS